jgi:Holliday junction resolvase RusA-like endonuclease
MLWSATILGEPASKSNSRKMVVRRSKKKGKLYLAPVKSDKALSYEEDAILQLKPLRPKEPIGEDLELTCHIWYANRRSDLDESLIMDLLQKAEIIINDRQIRSKHIYGYVDKHRPRAVVALARIAE